MQSGLLLERDFRSLKADDLDLRPIHHWLEDRVRGHVLICMFAAYLTWHLRRPRPAHLYRRAAPARANPVAPARRSADAKAATHTGPDGHPLRSFRGLLSHLATLTRSTIQLGGVTFDKISDPTPTQRRAFDLIKAPIPLTLTLKQTETPASPAANPSTAPVSLTSGHESSVLTVLDRGVIVIT